MKKIKYNDTYIYVDDSPYDEKKSGVVIRDNTGEELEKTIEYDLDDLKSLINDDSEYGSNE